MDSVKREPMTVKRNYVRRVFMRQAQVDPAALDSINAFFSGLGLSCDTQKTPQLPRPEPKINESAPIYTIGLSANTKVIKAK